MRTRSPERSRHHAPPRIDAAGRAPASGRAYPRLIVAGWAILLATGLALVGIGLVGHRPPDAPVPSADFSIAATPPADEGSARAIDPSARSYPPNRLVIESLGISAPVVPEPLDGAGGLVVPGDVGTVGRWAAGPDLAARVGTTVLAGHVDRNGDLGALYPLHRIEPGALVVVSDARGRGTRWRVTSLRTVPKERLPRFSATGERTLALVTCAGAVVDSPRGRTYADNLIATAVPET